MQKDASFFRGLGNADQHRVAWCALGKPDLVHAILDQSTRSFVARMKTGEGPNQGGS